MRVTYDREAGAAYIYLVDEIKKGESTRHIPMKARLPDIGVPHMVLDIDADGKLLGIEVRR